MERLENSASPIALVAGRDVEKKKIRKRPLGLRPDAPANTIEDPNRVLSWPEAEAIACVSRDTMLRAERREELKVTRMSARRSGIRRSELLRWLSEREANSALTTTA
jgi:hypothetical protein